MKMLIILNIPNWLQIFFWVGGPYIIIFLLSKLFKLITSNKNQKKQIIEQQNLNIELNKLYLDKVDEFNKRELELKINYQNWAIQELEKFKLSELENLKKTIEENAIKAADNLLQEWKVENEIRIRQDAINRSYSVNLGKITEHLLPFHIKFPFNPKDVRFIGSPIDLIVFDGYADKKEEIEICIIEIKTGNSKLTEIQNKIKTAVLKGNIRWAELNPDDDEEMN
jgi:predicted Holliday junction resolvase-like endonuclease